MRGAVYEEEEDDEEKTLGDDESVYSTMYTQAVHTTTRNLLPPLSGLHP
jgi:hypothetical protein